MDSEAQPVRQPMTREDYRYFVNWACIRHDPGTAARLIEERCRSPLPERLKRGPVVVPEHTEGDGAA